MCVPKIISHALQTPFSELGLMESLEVPQPRKERMACERLPPLMSPDPSIHLRTPLPLPRVRLLPRPSKRQPWKKLLYLNQRYPDNYTHELFLSQLRRNTTVVKYSYLKLVDDFSLIAQHLSMLLLVVLIFIGIYYQNWNPITPAIYFSILTMIGFALWDATSDKDTRTTPGGTMANKIPMQNMVPNQTGGGRSKLKSSILLLFILLLLSPVLRSLTKATASDSIWAIASGLTLANTLLHEYAMASDLATCKPIVSTNIAFSNAIVLASRLGSNVSVFCFVLCSIEISILLPIFDIHVRQFPLLLYHRTLFLMITVLVCVIVAKVLSLQFLVIWVCGQVGIVLVLPMYFLFLQKYKNELQGPWDSAKPKIRSS